MDIEEFRTYLKNKIGQSVDTDTIDSIVNQVEYMLQESYSEGYTSCGYEMNGVYQ